MSTRIAEAIDLPKLFEEAEELASYCHGNVDIVIEHSVTSSVGSGAITGLFGFFTSAYSGITGDLYISTKIQLKMVIAIAIIRGYDIYEKGIYLKAEKCINMGDREQVSAWKQIPIAGLIAGAIGDPITCQNSGNNAKLVFSKK